MVADDGERRLPGDALDGRLRVIGAGEHVLGLALEQGQHGFRRLAAVKRALEKAKGAGALGHGGSAAKDKAHPGGVQVIGLFGEFAQQGLARLGGQAVGHANQVGLFPAHGIQERGHGHGRAEKDGAPAGGFGQTQKADHPGNVDAFTQCSGDYCLHRTSAHDSTAGWTGRQAGGWGDRP